MSNSLQKQSILVMDDDEDVRFIAEFMLKRMGFTVELTSRGSEAIERYQKALDAGLPYHAVILDVNIPGGIGGREVLSQLLSLDPHVNAYISSGNPFDPLMADPAAFGFKGAISKPFIPENLRILLPPQ
jgi:CheY-like chemotaxis protein